MSLQREPRGFPGTWRPSCAVGRAGKSPVGCAWRARSPSTLVLHRFSVYLQRKSQRYFVFVSTTFPVPRDFRQSASDGRNAYSSRVLIPGMCSRTVRPRRDPGRSALSAPSPSPGRHLTRTVSRHRQHPGRRAMVLRPPPARFSLKPEKKEGGCVPGAGLAASVRLWGSPGEHKPFLRTSAAGKTPDGPIKTKTSHSRILSECRQMGASLRPGVPAVSSPSPHGDCCFGLGDSLSCSWQASWGMRFMKIPVYMYLLLLPDSAQLTASPLSP
ncbi:uncharacterized protein LOC108582533 [Papio anubis]|uniref:uncharacterized protein LOC108582533 n=1 Tax=Papio anubis TaxID=9555 RepID=UPI0012AD5469|nr:uncharacterized protein LOC108582533 [Papio anubis]